MELGTRCCPAWRVRTGLRVLGAGLKEDSMRKLCLDAIHDARKAPSQPASVPAVQEQCTSAAGACFDT